MTRVGYNTGQWKHGNLQSSLTLWRVQRATTFKPTAKLVALRLAARTASELGVQKTVGEGHMVIIDNESPPGAWEQELQRAPWAYGQRKPPTIDEVLWIMRRHGLTVEADIIVAELTRLKAEKS